MFDYHIARVTGANTHGTLMLIRHVGDQVVLDRIAGADFILVARIVGDVDFGRGVLIELAKHNARSANFEEGIALNHVVVGARDKVEARSRNLREYVTLYQKMMRIFDAERRIGAPQQILVTVQLFPVSAARIRKNINIEVCRLQIQKTFFAGASIVGMGEGQAFERHVTHLVLGILTQDAEQGIESRRNHMGRRHAFTGTRLIVKYVFLFVQVPFTRSVNQVVGIFEIEDLLLGRIAREGFAKHRISAMEQFGTFRILGNELCRTAVYLSLFKT